MSKWGQDDFDWAQYRKVLQDVEGRDRDKPDSSMFAIPYILAAAAVFWLIVCGLVVYIYL